MGGVKIRCEHVDLRKVVLCDWRGRCHPLDLKPLLTSIMESVSWVTEDILWEHEWVTEPTVLLP